MDHVRILKSWIALMAHTCNTNAWDWREEIRNWRSSSATKQVWGQPGLWEIMFQINSHLSNNLEKKPFRINVSTNHYSNPIRLVMLSDSSHIAAGILLEYLSRHSVYWGCCLLGLEQQILSSLQSLLGFKIRTHSKPAHHFKDLTGQLRSHKRDGNLFSLSTGHHPLSPSSQLSLSFCHSGRD